MTSVLKMQHGLAQVLTTCMLVELSTAVTAPDILDKLVSRVLSCVHLRLPVHATYVHMGVVRLIRRQDTIAVQHFLQQENVLERVLVALVIVCGDRGTHDSLLVALTVIAEYVAEIRLRSIWQDATLFEQIASTILLV